MANDNISRMGYPLTLALVISKSFPFGMTNRHAPLLRFSHNKPSLRFSLESSLLHLSAPLYSTIRCQPCTGLSAHWTRGRRHRKQRLQTVQVYLPTPRRFWSYLQEPAYLLGEARPVWRWVVWLLQLFIRFFTQ